MVHKIYAFWRPTALIQGDILELNVSLGVKFHGP